MTRRNKWRIVSLAGVAFCVYAYYLGADETSAVGEATDGNPVRVDRAENTYFDASGRPVQMSDDKLRDWSRRKGGAAVGARERFEYANPQLRRAEQAQDDRVTWFA